jgi:large subunit ribosomal protein L6
VASFFVRCGNTDAGHKESDQEEEQAMSRIGRLPIKVPQGVSIRIDGDVVEVTGPRGRKLVQKYDSRIKVEFAEKEQTIVLTRSSDSKRDKALHGTYRALIANMVEGLTKGYQKSLQITGVGYRAKAEEKVLDLTVGKSHPIRYPIPEGIEITVDGGTTINVKGADKQKVGEVAAEIRAFYPPEPYLGKGIRYATEHVRRKAGKTVG